MAMTKPPFSNDFLAKIKAILLEEKGRLERELAKFSRQDGQAADYNATFPDYGDKDDENAAEVAEYAANISIESDLEKALRDVLSALKRFEAGEYGICKYCQKPIEEKRLLARPTSSSCVACKKTIVQEV